MTYGSRRRYFYFYVPLVIIISSSLSKCDGKLSQDGLSTGITYCPRGIDHLLEPKPWYMLIQQTSRSPKRIGGSSGIRTTPNVGSSSGTTHESSTSIAVSQTSHTESSFYTIRGSSCFGEGQLAYVKGLNEMNEEVNKGIVRIVGARSLSRLFRTARERKEQVVVLFHGGSKCSWSEETWPIWIQVIRRLRSICMVAIDARKYPVHNYNMMVLGFPTIVRVVRERAQASYKGNRTVDDIVEWIVRGSSIAPLETKKDWGLKDDLWWYGMNEDQVVEQVKSDENKNHHEIDWALIGANFVTVGNIIWFVVKIWRRWKHKQHLE